LPIFGNIRVIRTGSLILDYDILIFCREASEKEFVGFMPNVIALFFSGKAIPARDGDDGINFPL
jgi:hypothetical protein